MGGVLGGIGKGLLDLLGGAYALKRQETEGYDWREKAAQAEFQRQQEREQARLQNEAAQLAQDEKLKGQLADVLAGSGEGDQPDLESLLPQNIESLRRQRIIKGALGAGKERKSALQAQKLAADQEREQIRQRGRMEALTKTQEFQDAQQEERIAAAREGRQASLDNALKRTEMMLEARKGGGGGGRGGGGAKPQLRSVWNPETGQNEYRWLSPGEDMSGVEPGRPAAMVQSQGMAQGAAENIKRMEALAKDVTAGPIAGRLSKAQQSIMGPSGQEGEFDFLGNSLVDTVYLKSGKQINEQEQKILREMIPNRARGNLPEQVRLFKAYSKHLLDKYGADSSEFTSASGAKSKAAAPKRRLKFNPATGALE